MNESHFLHLHVTRPHNRIAEDSVFTAQARSLLVYADFRLLPLCLCLLPPMDWKYKIFTHFGIGPSQQSSNLNVFRLNEDNELENEWRTVVRSAACILIWFNMQVRYWIMKFLVKGISISTFLSRRLCISAGTERAVKIYRVDSMTLEICINRRWFMFMIEFSQWLQKTWLGTWNMDRDLHRNDITWCIWYYCTVDF